MTDLFGGIFAIGGILFLLVPLAVFIYVFFFIKADVDHDGHDDVPYRWENKQAGNLRRVDLTKSAAAHKNVGASNALRQVTTHPGNCGVYHKTYV